MPHRGKNKPEDAWRRSGAFAMPVLTLIPVVLDLVFCQKFSVQGLTAGSTSG